jgi:hypothetical protein
MAVMVIAEVQGQTEPGYDGMLELLTGSLRQADGFVLHTAHAVDGGWRITEIWQSKDAANGFFAKKVANLPGIHPKRSVQELHSLLIPEDRSTPSCARIASSWSIFPPSEARPRRHELDSTFAVFAAIILVRA